MKFGIIGFGRMGQVYHDVLTSMNHEISFVCDVIKPVGIVNHYYDYKIPLEKAIDGLVVSTTGPSHSEIIIHAIEKNIKYIVCEKPFTTSVKQADEIIEKLKKSDTKLTINYSRRYSEAYSTLKENLNNDIIGKPKTVVITCGAGGLSAVGTHFFDLCTYFLDSKIKSVFAISINKNLSNPRGKEFEDPGGYVLLNFENETRAFIDLGDDLGIQHIIEIIGEHGRVVIDELNDEIMIRGRSADDRQMPKHKYVLPNPIIKKDRFGLESTNKLIEKMIQNLISEKGYLVTAQVSKGKVEIYSAIRKSFDTKKEVDLPLTGEYYNREFIVT
ncbi:MAG: Gfo/Idh/MocA family oxidoreductase [Nitrosopumilaceae archaeon]